MIKYGVADWGLFVWYGGRYDYYELIEAVRGLGFDGIERLYPKSAEDALTKASYLRGRGMSFATAGADDPELDIKWTSALGRDYVWQNVFGAGSFDDSLRRLREQTRIANKYGVDVAVHNHLGTLFESQEQVEEMLSACPDTKLLFDVGHLAVAGGDVEYIANKYYDRIKAYHFKGWQTSATPNAEKWSERGYFCGLMQGDFFVNNEAVYKNALRRGFDGWMFIEHDTHKRDPLLDLEESFDVLKKWRNEI